jgi:hypothetical protein
MVMVMVVVVTTPIVVVVVVSPLAMMMVVMMMVILRELNFSRLALRPRRIISLEGLHSIGNRVQKFRVGAGA